MLSQPLRQKERYRHIDVLRGVALFGVLLINVLSDFRVGLFEHILHPGADVVDVLAAAFVEFRAFTLFAFLFGVGAAIQSERVPQVDRFLLRRFAVLLGFGLIHMLLIWNGDILTLYGVCGFLLIAALHLPLRELAGLGIALLLLGGFLPLGFLFPGKAVWRAAAEAAGRVYPNGSWMEVLRFRWHETRLLVPFWESSLPRTFALMCCGAAAWRSGLLRSPRTYRTFLLGFVWAGAAGLAMGNLARVPGEIDDVVRVVIPAFGYAAAVLLWAGEGAVSRGFAAVGRMALTNYLMQSVVLGLVFYGYGLGLFGKVSAAAGLGIAVALYLAQIVASVWWLGRHEFGPMEWVWRRLSYGR